MSCYIGHIALPHFPLLLAPMEDVSDPPFRSMCKKYGADLMFTEFISSEGLIRNAIKSKKKLDISEEERPIGIQIFGGDEEAMALSAKIVETVEPDLIDINFGCPVKKVVCKGAGAAVLKDIPLMVKLTKAVVQSTHLPVTVKTRLGWDENTINIKEVALRLQDVGIKAMSIHGRTRQQMYKGKANWDMIGEVKQLKDISIPIFGNGDVSSPQEALYYKEKYHIDGIMIGRAAIGNPWIFNQVKHFLQYRTFLTFPSLQDRIECVKTHLMKSIAWKGEKIGVFEMRPHYSHYFKGLENSKNIRQKLVSCISLSDILTCLNEII